MKLFIVKICKFFLLFIYIKHYCRNVKRLACVQFFILERNAAMLLCAALCCAARHGGNFISNVNNCLFESFFSFVRVFFFISLLCTYLYRPIRVHIVDVYAVLLCIYTHRKNKPASNEILYYVEIRRVNYYIVIVNFCAISFFFKLKRSE